MSKTVDQTETDTTHSAPQVPDVQAEVPQPFHEPVPAPGGRSSKLQRSGALPAGSASTRARGMNELQRTVGNARAGMKMASVKMKPALESQGGERKANQVERITEDHGTTAHPDSTSAGEPQKAGHQDGAKKVQAKLSVSSPGDVHEQEADRVAEKVTQKGQESGPVARVSRIPTNGGIAAADRDATDKEKTGGAEGGVNAGIENRIKSPSGGQPLPEKIRREMEPGLGADFSGVRVHDSAADKADADRLNAKAFTHGSDIWIGSKGSADDPKLMAHELTHVAQQGFADGKDARAGSAATQVMRAPGPLTAAQEASARTFMKSTYDERSIRIVQLITGTNVDGKFGDISAQAVATFQGANGLGVDGKVGANTLNPMVADRVAAGRHDNAVQLVVDFHNLNVRSDTLSVHFDATLGAVVGATAFGPGNLRVITLGPLAFTSEPALLAAITAQLAAPAPAVPPIAPRPALLTRAQELSAITFNRDHFRDRRSALAIQGHAGANPDGIFGPDTVQRIADAQRIAGLAVDGKVGRATLELFTTGLIAAGQQDGAIRLIIDFFNIRDDGNLLDVFFDPTVTDNAATTFSPNQPVRVRVGPSGLAQPFAGIVHTIAHEFEHVRRLKQGIADRATQEFLGEAVEILSQGTPEEALEIAAPGGPGFVGGFADDAHQAVDNWNLMPLADQRRFRLRFIAVRQRVRARIAAGTPPQQALHAALLAQYNAVVVPAP